MSDTVIEASGRFAAAAHRLPTLFDLTDEMMAVLSLLDVPEDESEVDAVALEQRREELAAALLQKTENYGTVIKTLEKMAEARKAEADRLRARAKSSEAGADWLRARLLTHMQQTGQERIETARYTFAARLNPPSVVVLEEDMVPAEFKVITVAVSKSAIRDHIKATGEIPAGCDWTRGTSLRIS